MQRYAYFSIKFQFFHTLFNLMELKQVIKKLSKENYQEVVEIRRHLHTYPELSFEEHETSKFIQSKLKEYGINFISGIAGTGVVALIKGKNPDSKCIALRADIDALPIQELNDVSYRSKKNGVMHACGHDVHTASLLVSGKILNLTKDYWSGTIKLIFQPAEEKFPGGANQMIKEGVLENPKVDKILGQHVSPELNCGLIGMCSGMFMASADEIYITVIGKGGHAALPDLNLNPIIIASKIIISLNNFFKKINDTPCVFSIGSFSGGTMGNIVPDNVKIQGTFRAMNEQFREQSHIDIKKICDEIIKKEGGSCLVDIKKGYPFLKNDKKFTNHCFNYAKDYIESEKVINIPKRMTAEDFSYYSHYVPSCFYRLGVGFKNKSNRTLHNSYFDINEKALELSVGMLSWLAITT